MTTTTRTALAASALAALFTAPTLLVDEKTRSRGERHGDDVPVGMREKPMTTAVLPRSASPRAMEQLASLPR